MESQNAALSMLTDWIVSTGNTSVSVDLLLKFLEQMHRNDIVDSIHREQGDLSTASNSLLAINI